MNRWLMAACTGVAMLGAAQAQKAVPAVEQARIANVMSSLGRGTSIGQVAVSPDGRWLAWLQGSRGGREIQVARLDDPAQSRHISAGGLGCSEGEIAWAPDSRELAFFSDCANKGEQSDIYLAVVDGADSAARRVTHLNGNINAPSFSPDGKQIGFLYVEGATRPASAVAAEKPPAGVIGEDDVEVQRVAVIPADPPQPVEAEFFSPANLHVFEFDWSPDSKSLAYVAADPPGENNWWVAKLYTQGAGAEPKAILAPADVDGRLHGMQIAVPRWSPDGRQIAFIGGLMSDQGVTGGDVWTIPSRGGALIDLTPGNKATASWLAWDGSQKIFVDEIAGGDCQLVEMNVSAGSVSAVPAKTLFRIAGTVGDGGLELELSASADHSIFVLLGSAFERAPEIYALRPGKLGAAARSFGELEQITHLNGAVRPVSGKVISYEWKNEGFDVQGWLMLPAGYDPAKKYPMIVEVHGGPASAALSRWGRGGSLSPEAFSALGYFVLLPNPRGSFGQGEAFTQANRKDFGYGDLRDIEAGVDAVLARYPVDAKRVGLTGWSYGGFMSMFAVTQTQRFRAAVAGAGIANWQSYYGENQIDQWMIPYFGASVYDDPKVYAKSSAIDFIKQAKTPTLVVVGDRDGECPAPQSYEFWHGLRDQHVPAQLVVYPNEGHGFRNPEHTRDVLERAARWFAEFMPAE